MCSTIQIKIRIHNFSGWWWISPPRHDTSSDRDNRVFALLDSRVPSDAAERDGSVYEVAPERVVRKYEPDYIKYGFIMTDSEAWRRVRELNVVSHTQSGFFSCHVFGNVLTIKVTKRWEHLHYIMIFASFSIIYIHCIVLELCSVHIPYTVCTFYLQFCVFRTYYSYLYLYNVCIYIHSSLIVMYGT